LSAHQCSCDSCCRRESAVVTDGRRSRVVFRGDELYVLKFEAKVIQGFLNQVGVLLADVTELRSRHADINDRATGVTVTCGFQPRVVRVAIDFFLKRVEDADPRIGGDCCTCNRHLANHSGRYYRPFLPGTDYSLFTSGKCLPNSRCNDIRSECPAY